MPRAISLWQYIIHWDVEKNMGMGAYKVMINRAISFRSVRYIVLFDHANTFLLYIVSPLNAGFPAKKSENVSSTTYHAVTLEMILNNLSLTPINFKILFLSHVQRLACFTCNMTRVSSGLYCRYIYTDAHTFTHKYMYVTWKLAAIRLWQRDVIIVIYHHTVHWKNGSDAISNVRQHIVK